MKNILRIILSTFIIISCFISNVFADDTSYSFILTVDGKNEKQVETDDVLTVSLSLKCNGTNSCTITSFQDEIIYDSEFFELVHGSSMTYEGVRTTDISLYDRYRAYYVNYVGIDGPIIITNGSLNVAMIQMKVNAKNGVSRLKNNNCIVTDENGEEISILQDAAFDVTAIRDKNIEIHLKDEQGNLIENQFTDYQKPMKKPNVTNSEGLIANEWNTDLEGDEPWNFDDDVEENMTIFGDDWAEKERSYDLVIYMTLAISFVFLILLLLKKKKKDRDKDFNR